MLLHRARSSVWPAAGQWWPTVGFAGCLALGLGLAYGRIGQATFVADDFVLLVQTRNVPFSIDVFRIPHDWIFYRPLGIVLWMLEGRLFGVSALGYHLVSLALHAINCLLVYVLWKHLLPRPAVTAPAAALLFAVFPLNVEAIAWLASQYDLLGTTWYLLCLHCMLAGWRQGRCRWLVAGAGACQLSLWSKEFAATLPLVLIVVWLTCTPRPRARALLGAVVPTLALIALNMWQRFAAWASFGGYETDAAATGATAVDRLLGALRVMLVPLNPRIAPAVVVQAILLVSCAVVLLGLLSRPHGRGLRLGLSWIGLTLLPVVSVLPPTSQFGNTRFFYLPAIGATLCLVLLVEAIARRFRYGRTWHAWLGAVAGVGLLILAVQLNLAPWITAGHAVDQLIVQLHALVPRATSGTTIQVEGLPTDYRGALVLHMGLAPAYALRYGPLLDVHPVARIKPRALLESPTDLYQVKFGAVTADGVPLLEAHGMTQLVGEQSALPGERRWDARSCTDIAAWQIVAAAAACSPETGLQLDPTSADPSMLSPPLALDAARWTEVVVVEERQSTQAAPTAIQLFWQYADAVGTTEDQSQSFELRPQPGRYAHHFFVPPAAAHKQITQLRIDPINAQQPVRIVGIALRSIDVSALASASDALPGGNAQLARP